MRVDKWPIGPFVFFVFYKASRQRRFKTYDVHVIVPNTSIKERSHMRLSTLKECAEYAGHLLMRSSYETTACTDSSWSVGGLS